MTLATAVLEYRALLHDAAQLDLAGWRVLRLVGPDARDFLQGMATQDMAAAGPGRAAETLFLTEKGRPLALAWVAVESSGAEAWVVADAASSDALRPHFERFRIMEDVEFEESGAAGHVIGVAGPTRAARLAGIAAGVAGSRALEGEPLSFLLVPRQSAEPVECISPEAAEAWRLAVGLPRAGVDFTQERLATELDLPGAICFTKGCYVGQEVVARTSNRGQVRRRRVGFRFAWPGAAPASGTPLLSGGSAAGFLTSAVREPGSDDALAMGYLATEIDPPGAVVLAIPDGAPLPIRVAPWPL
ncbi:MAG: YgfZ/GcvT domain-containing protein [Bacteroidota bacterium]